MNQQNADFFPYNDIPDSNFFPTMTGVFEYTKLEDGKSSTNKRMLRGQFTCIEPEAYAGMCHFEYFTVGTDEQPDIVVKGTMGAKALKASLKAAQMPEMNSVQQVCDMITGSKPRLMLSLIYKQVKQGQTVVDERNNVTAWKKLGEAQVSVTPTPGVTSMGGGGSAAMGMPQMPLAPQPQAHQAPAAMPQTAPVPPRMMPPVQQPAVPQPVTQMPPAQAVPPQPSAPAAMQPTPQPAPVAPAAPMPGIPCHACGRTIPVDKFTEHIQRHANDPNWNGAD